MNKWTKILAWVATCIFTSVGLVISYHIWAARHPIIALLVIGMVALSVVIFVVPKAYPFRFMYPGLITFLFFMMMPIMFSIFIAFTNLSTGHLVSKEAAYDLLIHESYIPEDSTEYRFYLIKSDLPDQMEIFVYQDENMLCNHASLSLKSQAREISIELTETPLDEVKSMQKLLKPGEIVKLDFLKNLTFVLPNKNKVQYFRSSLLATIVNIYEPVGDYKLKDTRTGEIYYPDHQQGFFTNGTKPLEPGFFVTVGFRNFKDLFTKPEMRLAFGKVIGWTFVWAFMSVLLTFSLGMFLALLVNNKDLRLKFFYRILLILPYSVPFFISVLVFKGMLNKDYGIINHSLASLGISAWPWLSHPTLAKLSCLMVNLWLGFPYMFLVTTGILQSIPGSVYEAAALDGARRWQTFRHITLPLIFSAIGPLLVGSFAFNFNNFVGIYLLTGGGPAMAGGISSVGETDILISATYRLAFEGGSGANYGLASSIALFIFVIIAIVTLINFKLSGIIQEKEER